MALSSELRAALMSSFMQTNMETLQITKPQLQSVISALDTFLDDNAATINQAIPSPMRSLLTVSQKAHLLALVTLKRWG